MSTPLPPDPGPARQRAIYLPGLAGRRPLAPVAAAELEARAREVMSGRAFAYVAGGAGAEQTMAANRAAFDRRQIVPNVLRDSSRRDLSVELLGRRLPVPLLTAPIGVLDLAHPDADLAVARAAAGLGVPVIFSNQASVPMEECAAAMGASPRWFQLYWSSSDELVASFVRRAEAAGCEAVVVTLDTSILGWRARDLDQAYLPFLEGRGIAQYTSDPVFRAQLREPQPALPRPPVNFQTAAAALAQKANFPGGLWRNLFSGEPRAAVQRFFATYSRPSLTWADLPRLRTYTRLPIILKGVLHPDDARRALDAGVDGLVVSNHGGRQIDGAVASLDALPGVVAAVDGRIPVLLDSGPRGGADVFKAIALGARAVLVGRPFVYGLACAGEGGVREVLQNWIAELDLTLALAGCRSLAEVNPAMLREQA
ncbi:MAG: alpha-hydroxy-acid oxidizing protein [Verrucomicrobia bacterium]|nr:alpha-hydroxy-acid oxidizing protein [Verrucomicrobiota bacterium]